MVTNDCICNYMFLADQNSYDIKPVLSSYFVPLSEEEVTMIDDQSLIIRKQGSHQSSNRGTIMVEQEAAINMEHFPKSQHFFYHGLKDLLAAFMESYILGHLKISHFLSLPMFPSMLS